MTKPIPKSLAEIKKRVKQAQDEIPMLIQPERRYVQDTADLAKLIEVVEVLTKATPLKHLDNGSISANECLCLIRRDTENALTQVAQILEEKI